MDYEKVIDAIMEAINSYGMVRTVHQVFGNKVRLKIGYSAKCCATTLDDLQLSQRAYNCLRRAGIHTVGSIIEAIQKEELFKVRCLGAKTYKEIRIIVLEYGFSCMSDKEKRNFLKDLLKEQELRSA